MTPSYTATGVPLRSPTGVRWYQPFKDAADLYLGMLRGGLQDNQSTCLIRWNATKQIYEDIGQTMTDDPMPDRRVRAMCMWRGKLVVALHDSSSLYLYDNKTWRTLSVPRSGIIETMVAFKNDLYVGGGYGSAIRTIGGVTVGSVARFDGSHWHAVGSKPGTPINGPCYTLVVFDGQLYAGGYELLARRLAIDTYPYYQDVDLLVGVMRLKTDGTWEPLHIQNEIIYKLKVHRGMGGPEGALVAHKYFGSMFGTGREWQLRIWNGLVGTIWLKVSDYGKIADFESFGPNLAYIPQGSAMRNWSSGLTTYIGPNMSALGHQNEDLIGGSGFVTGDTTGHKGPWRYQPDTNTWLPIGNRSIMPGDKSLPTISHIESINRSAFTSHQDEPII